MTLSVRAVRGALGAAALLVGFAACGEDDADIVDPTVTGGDLFRSYVAIGNSLTAGYQSSGINDSTQRESFAYLFAQQLYGADVGARFRYPAFVLPGCPAPLNSLTGTRVGGAAANACALRAPTSVVRQLNNVAVPGTTVADLTGRTVADTTNPLFTFILGGRSQIQRAVEARPTFVTVWAGNNDVLDAAVRGSPVPVPQLTSGITSVANFITRYDAALDTLQTASTLRGGVLIGVVNVTNAPILFPAQAMLNPAFKAGFDQYVGKTTVVLPDCAGSPSLLSFAIVSFFRSRPAAEPAVIGCTKNSVPGNPSIGDFFILDAAEQATVRTTVDAYNAYIRAKADSLGWAFLDPNPILVQLRSGGQIPATPNLANPAQPYGANVSVDGVHPTRATHVLVANALIAAIKAKYPEASALGTVQ